MHVFSTPILVALVVLVVLAVVAALVRQLGAAPIANVTYEAVPALLTPAERSFYGVLQQAVATDYQIFAKVRLADIVRPTRPLARRRRQAAFNRISAKHADFVLCERQTLRVVGVIELDDTSHARSGRQARDSFVDSALAAAGIGILRVSARQSYSPAQLREQINKAFSSNERITNKVGSNATST